MSFAMDQWTGFLADHQRARDAKQVSAVVQDWVDAAEAWHDRCMRAEARALKAEDEASGGFALQTALEQFIARCYPKHLLVEDKQLRARIYGAGVTAASVANSYSAAREAGRTFVMPPEVDEPLKETRRRLHYLDMKWGDLQLEKQGFKQKLGLISTVSLEVDAAELLKEREELEAAKAEVRSLSVKLSSVTRDCAHHMAQAAAFKEQLTQADPTHPLITDPGLRQRVAEEAYRRLEQNGGKDWSVVKEVGRTFGIPGRQIVSADDLVESFPGEEPLSGADEADVHESVHTADVAAYLTPPEVEEAAVHSQ